MSKLIDRLETVAKKPPTPMGFGAAARSSVASPSLALIGSLTPDELSTDPSLAQSPVDAFLVTLTTLDKRSLSRLAKELSDRVWGVRIGTVDEDQAKDLADKGCDFIAFDAENTAAAVLTQEELGKVITVDAEITDDLARAIQDLAIDGALYSPENLLPMTVQRVLDIRLVSGLVAQPFLMFVPPESSAADLQAFRDAGVLGLVVPLSSQDAVAKMKKAIDALPPRKPKSERQNPLVPQLHMGSGEVAPAEEEEEEEYDPDF